MIAWAQGPAATLAMGTAKGNLQLFDLHKRRRVPVMGKATKRVTCGAWGSGGVLALGAADRAVRGGKGRGKHVAVGTRLFVAHTWLRGIQLDAAAVQLPCASPFGRCP